MLEKVGIKPRRVAGTCGGAIVGALIVAGFSVAEIQDFMKMDLKKLVRGIGYSSNA